MALTFQLFCLIYDHIFCQYLDILHQVINFHTFRVQQEPTLA